MSYRSAEEKIRLAKDDSVDRLYERTNQRTIRVLTVCLYVLCVSLAAIMLSLYYIFIWDPQDAYRKLNETQYKQCEKIIIPQQLAIRLANSSEVSAETFFKNFFERLQDELEKSEQKQQQEELNTFPVQYQRKKIEEILKKVSRLNSYDDPKFKIKHQTTKIDKLQMDSRGGPHKNKNKMDNRDDEDDLDYEHSGSHDSNVEVTTIHPNNPTTQDLNDTTIIFDDQEVEVVGTANGS